MRKLIKLSITIAAAGLTTLTATEAIAFSLSYDRTIGRPGTGRGEIFLPQGITVQDTTNHVWISDGENDRLQVFTRDGKFIKTVGKSGSGAGEFDEPADLEFDPQTGDLYVGDVFNSRINVFDAKGNYLKSFGEFGGPVEGRLFFGPGGLTFGPDGNLYVTDFSNDYIQVFNKDGEQIAKIGSSGTGLGQFLGPAGISISPYSGNIYVSDQLNNRIQVLNRQGQPLFTFGKPGSGPGEFNNPIGVEIDEYENIYVGDAINSRVQVFDRNGKFLTSFGKPVPGAQPGPIPPGTPLPPPGQFNWAAGAHYDKGELFVGDFFNSRIQVLKVNPIGRGGCSRDTQPRTFNSQLIPQSLSKIFNGFFSYSMPQASQYCYRYVW